MAVKANSPKWAWFVAFFVIGCVLGCTQLFAPLHEAAHVSVAQSHGVRAYVSGWAETQMDSLNRPAILAGWTAEVVSFGALAFFVVMVGFNSPWITGGFWYALSFVHWLRAFGSSDFNSTLAKSFGDARAFELYHVGLMNRWALWGIIGYAVLGIVILLSVRKKSPVK